MEQQKIIFLINPYCHQNKGWKLWNNSRQEVCKRISTPGIEVVMEKGFSLVKDLANFLDPLENTCIISVGGDGTTNSIVNCLMNLDSEQRGRVTLGTVGLGSSNDFLKPFGDMAGNIPLRIQVNKGHILHDVGRASYCSVDNKVLHKYFVVNASLGVTAAANYYFNQPGPMLRFLKKNISKAAIVFAAVKTILLHRNINYTYNIHNEVNSNKIANINILKVPYVSGSFHYDQDIARDSGQFMVNMCFDLSRLQLIAVLANLYKGKFNTGDKKISVRTDTFQISTGSAPFIFEYDGETDLATNIEFSVLKNAIKILKY